MPDLQVRAGDRATTLHSVLRGGRHVLVVPAARAASVLSDPGLRPYRRDLDIVTAKSPPPRIRNDGTGPVVLVRPDGYVAARGRLGGMQSVTGYLRSLLSEPAGEHAGERPPAAAPGR